MPWKQSEYSHSESVHLGDILTLSAYWRLTTKENPAKPGEQYEFRIGDATSTKKFPSIEAAKKQALLSARNRLTKALQEVAELEKELEAEKTKN